jgi:hypothetical protein
MTTLAARFPDFVAIQADLALVANIRSTQLASALAKLAAVDGSIGIMQLSALTENVARLQGEGVALRIVQLAFAEPPAFAEPAAFALSAIAQALATNPDDTYSGRGNDLRRSKNDGFRQVLGNSLQRYFA